jgi:alkylated DNA repair dioxygenase AlkB
MQSKNLTMPDADVTSCERFFSPSESDIFLQRLLTEIEWKQKSIKLFGREIPEPRLTAWYGDEDALYTYSGITNQPLPWNSLLLTIKHRCEEVCGVEFNSVLLNYYRDGSDSMVWHQDNEPELGAEPIIASVSFGATRRFQFRHKKRNELPTISVDLSHGNLLIMKGKTQQFWKHQLPKTSKAIGTRINLTFRTIVK